MACCRFSSGKAGGARCPHLICIPEKPLDEEDFISRMEEIYRRFGFAVAVVNENVRGSQGPLGHRGGPLYVDDFGHHYFQSPAQYLAGKVSQRLRVRARYERPGTIQRSLVSCISKVDALEAYLVGQMAVRYALEGATDMMVTLVRETPPISPFDKGGPAKRDEGEYRCITGVTPLETVAGKERLLPDEYFDAGSNMATKAFLDYARPLMGGPLPRFVRLGWTF